MNDFCMIESAFDNKKELNKVVDKLLSDKLVSSCQVINSESTWESLLKNFYC